MPPLNSEKWEDFFLKKKKFKKSFYTYLINFIKIILIIEGQIWKGRFQWKQKSHFASPGLSYSFISCFSW